VTRALIPARVVIQVQLVILLSIPPLPRGQNFGDHVALPPLLVHLLSNLLRYLLLLSVVVKDRAAVLRPRIRALAIRRGGIVHLVEELEERGVRDFLGVECDLQGLGIYRGALVRPSYL
jgi:hypothetical protein